MPTNASAGASATWRTWATALGVLVVLGAVGIVVATADLDQPRGGGVRLPDLDEVADPPPAIPRDPLGRPGPIVVSAPDVSCADPSPPVTVSCPSWQISTGLPVEVLLSDRDEVIVGIGHQVVVLDAATGQVRWHRDLPAPMGHQPAVDTDAVYVLDADATVTALDRGTGAFRWQTTVGARSDLVTTAGVLVVKSSRGVTGLDTADGSPRWEVAVSGDPSPPAAVSGWVFVGDGNGRIRAIEATTGLVAWVTDANGWYVTGHPHQQNVAASGFNGPLVGLDRATGDQVWESDIEVAWSVPSPMPGGRAFLIHSVEGDVHIVNASDGTSTPVAQVADQAVTVDLQGLLYLTEPDGLITAIAHDGQQLWADTSLHGIGAMSTGWVNGSPWLFVVDGSYTTLAGLPGMRRPPPARVDAVAANQPCPVTPLQDRPYRTVAAGHFTELSGAGILPDGTYLTTLVSVTDEHRNGPVTLTGRRLDAPGTMTFLPTRDAEPVRELILSSPDGFRLGGPDGMPPHWAVLVNDVEPGCWSYDLQTADGQVDQIIVNITS